MYIDMPPATPVQVEGAVMRGWKGYKLYVPSLTEDEEDEDKENPSGRVFG